MNKLKYLVLIRRSSVSLDQLIQVTCRTVEKSIRRLHSVTNVQKLPSSVKIDNETINLLERLSLVNCASKSGIETLEAAIQFADQIMEVDVSNIEPLITVLEDFSLITREDKITDGTFQEEVLINASLTEDGYFVTPPGNVVLEVAENVTMAKIC